MSTLDDKILGVKKDYLCSSESENESDSPNDDCESVTKAENTEKAYCNESTKWEGSSRNTGPKGVIRDWQRYKLLESEKKEEQAVERLQFAKKLTLSTSRNDNEEKELLDLVSDEFLLEYQKQRMEEMLRKPATLPSFGVLINLKTGNDFLNAIDNENKCVTVVIHIYEENNSGCKTMNKCLKELSKQYPSVKFCKIIGSAAGMSYRFKVSGVPALLVYKEGSVIGNFVRVTDDLGDDFYTGDVENFLIEHGMINDRFCIPSIINEDEGGSTSDWSLD